MKDFSIKEAVRYGWETFKANKKLLILSSLVFLIASNLPSYESLERHFSAPIGHILAIAFFIISSIVTIGWYKLLLGLMDGRKPSLNELFSHKRLFFRYVFTLVAFFAIAGIPLIVFSLLAVAAYSVSFPLSIALGAVGVVLSIYASLRYMFAITLVIDKEVSLGSSFKESARMTESVKWRLVCLCIVTGLVAFLGILAFGIGLLVSLPISTLAFLHVYRKLLPLKADAAEVLKTA
jgi:uncharacterized membrane protein